MLRSTGEGYTPLPTGLRPVDLPLKGGGNKRNPRSYAFTPAPSAGGASGSSGQRARAGAERSSISPRESRMAPAQAIMAALSVQSSGGGTIRRKMCFRAVASSVDLSLRLAATPPATTRMRWAPLSRVPLVELERARRSVAEDVGDRFLEARAEIGHVLLAERRAGHRFMPESGLEPGEREMRLVSPEHRPRQLDSGPTLRRHAFDLGSAGIAKPEELRRLVERLAEGIVERRAKPLVIANVLDD